MVIISHKYKFIFIHIYKTAGTSVRHALIDYMPWYKKNKFINYIIYKYCDLTSNYNYNLIPEHPEIQHARAIDIKKKISAEVFNNYYKFAFVRNPWDWQVSIYFNMLKDPNHFQHDLAKSFNSFDEYIEWRVNGNIELQKNFLIDYDGKFLVDYIGKIENLYNDFTNICNHIGLTPIELQHKNKSKHNNYKKYYNDYTKKLVEDAFKEDIELFNYTFD